MSWLLIGLSFLWLSCRLSDVVPEPIAISQETRVLHDRAVIANLHADFAMFNRDVTRRSNTGVSDFPRMREAGVGLVGASIVPRGIGGELVMRLAFWWWGWPPEARGSPLARALAQIDRIDQFLSRDPQLRAIRFREDLEGLGRGQVLGILLTLEGGQPFVDDPGKVRTFYERGVRTMQLTHASNNELGGSGSPTLPGTEWHLESDPGLTELGRRVLREMSQVGMIVDLAHASPRMFADVLATFSGPVFVSHAAVAALHASQRNLTDDQLRAIAARDGIVGIMAQRQFLGGDHLASVADHILHAVHVAGIDHVGLGLDMEEVTDDVLPPELRDVRDLPRLTQLLGDRGLSPDAIEKILGQNALRFLGGALPSRSTKTS